MKKCIYISIIGNYDSLKDPNVITPGWDYICFTDNSKLKSKIWDIRFVEDKENLGYKKFSRSFWILNHIYVNDYDISISTGGQIQCNTNLDLFINEFLPLDQEIDIAMHDRGIRKGVFQEASKCIAKNKDNPNIIRQQMDFYKKEGMPDNTGILSTGIIIRKHHRQNLEEHCEKWWEQVFKWSHRDQLSFNYVLWKYNLIKVSRFSRDVLRGENNLFKKYKHL